MKFFTKIYLLFLLVILFSSLTSAFLLFQFIEQSSLQEASENMKESSDIISMNFESVERNMWRYLAKIQNDEQLIRILNSGEWSHEEIINILLAMPQPLEVDFIVLSGNGYSVLPVSNFTVPYEELFKLSMTRWHPNIGIMRFTGGLSMSGSIRLGLDEKYIDIFLVKDFNREFCERLTYNTTADVLIINDGKIMEGTLNEDRILVEIPGTDSGQEYTEYFGVIRDSKEFNAVLRRLSLVELDRTPVMILSLFSNVPYAQRIEKLSSSILMVVILSAVLATFISLIFSRTITRPIQALSDAMVQIKRGDFTVTVPTFGGMEISRLVEGFNRMAGNLKQDQIEQQNYITRIKFLSDYNEEIIESIGAGICIINDDLVIEKTNRKFRDIFKYNEPDAENVGLDDIHSRIISRKIHLSIEKILGGQLSSYSSGRIADDDRFYQIQLYHLSGNKCIMTIDNITYRSVLEDRLYQAEKLNSLSVLSAGVAHEINNPLSSIMTNVQNLLYDESDPQRIEALRWVDQETRRIARIVSDLLNFSSNAHSSRQQADINHITEQLIRFSGYSSGNRKMKYIADLPDEPAVTAISSDELKQIMFNLFLNAEQAVSGAGEIKISVKNCEDHILMKIEDNGAGMDQETLGRVYDPFFTTKKNRGGTGLGLSVVYGIIRKYQAEIDFESVPDKGTTVSLKLPVPSVQEE